MPTSVLGLIDRFYDPLIARGMTRIAPGRDPRDDLAAEAA